jgi:hypothetical protein
MTDISASFAESFVGNESAAVRPHFAIEEKYWGYVIRPTTGPGLFLVAQQLIATFLGATSVAAALGLLLVPDLLTGGVDFAIRAGAAVVFAGVAALLLWYASRGTQSELQVDNSQGEVREVVRNRTGRSALVGRYGYDAIGGVFIERVDARGTLVLRYRNTAQTLFVASGPIEQLERLRDRLGQDLMLSGNAIGSGASDIADFRTR